MSLFAGRIDRKRIKRFIALGVVVAGFLLLGSLGGRSTTAAASTLVAPRTYQIVITGTSGSINASTTALIAIK